MTSGLVNWPLELLHQAPATHPADEITAPGVEAVFYDTLPWRGQPTRTFAWVGYPEGDGPFPTMVLVHGGGGTAFADWVRSWNRRGYAAIAMDTCGCTPGGDHPNRPRHAHAGPPGWGASFTQVDEPIADQWTFHAVADVMLAHSLLAADERIDASRIGLHGISWGGYLACVVAGVDVRLKAVVSSYGSGYFWQHEPFPDPLTDHQREAWYALWDASQHLPRAAMPMLWASAPNDFAFPLPAQWQSAEATAGPTTMSIDVLMRHGQVEGANPIITRDFVEQHLNGGPPLVSVRDASNEGRRLHAHVDGPIDHVQVAFTRDDDTWAKREWFFDLGDFDPATGRMEAQAPPRATCAYLNAIDMHGRVISARPVWKL